MGFGIGKVAVNGLVLGVVSEAESLTKSKSFGNINA